MTGYLSSSSAMKIVELSPELWDQFALTSPQGTVYDRCFFHNVHGFPVRYWAVSKGSEIIAGVAAIEQNGGLHPLFFQDYAGILYRPFLGYKNSTRIHLIYEATCFIADFLFTHYESVFLYNHWGVGDIRPFQWVNYNMPEQGGYDISVRYTVLMNLSETKDPSLWRTLRRRDLMKASSSNIVIKPINDVASLDRLQAMTFDRQSRDRFSEQMKNLPKFVEALERHRVGQVFIAYSDGEAVAGALFSYDRNRAYFMAGGMHSEATKLGASTRLMADCFQYFHSAGLREIDLVGANSPRRSHFKLGFGGVLQPLFQVTSFRSKTHA